MSRSIYPKRTPLKEIPDRILEMFVRETGKFLWIHYLCKKNDDGGKLSRHQMMLQWDMVVRHMTNWTRVYRQYNKLVFAADMWLEETFFNIFIEHADHYFI